MQRLKAKEFLECSGKIVDVRSPAEFEEGHLAHAINIPLFSNDERARVGTCYKQQGREQAISLGLKLVGPRLSDLAIKAKSLDASELRIYCWRGGMRSAKMAELFELGGQSCHILEGGYKAYRNELLDAFDRVDHLIVLQGATGAGKTRILHELQKLGEQIIDLEGLANHRGSAFGGIGMPPQPTTQQFQNACFDVLRDFDFGKRIWVEGESKSIGRVYLPETLWAKMNATRLIEIDVPLEARIQTLVEDYGELDKEALSEAITKITRKLGGQHATRALADLAAGNAEAVAGILLAYYDKSYHFSREKYKTQIAEVVSTHCNDAAYNARLLLDKAKAGAEAVKAAKL